MIKCFFILCSLLCIQDEPTLSWNESYKLTWSDFKATSKQHASAAAITASGITFGLSIKQSDAQVFSFTTEVHAHFYPEQSWYKKDTADNHVLSHEQLHFDITELHARKFRQRISVLKVSNSIRQVLKSLNETVNKELATMQNKYDDETDYSRNFKLQAKWKVYIANELQKLSKYKQLN